MVSHSEKKALRAGAFLKIPEMWVLDLPRHRLRSTTWRSGASRKARIGRSPGAGRSRPDVGRVLERLDDPETDDATSTKTAGLGEAVSSRVSEPRTEAFDGSVSKS